MKIILIGLVFIVAWKAGYVLLMAICIGALLLTHVGINEIKDGRVRGEGKIVLGFCAGAAALLTALLKLAFLLLTWISLSTVFPGFVPWIKSVLAWVTSL